MRQLRRMQDLCTVSGENAGLHVLLSLKNGRNEREAVELAGEAGIHILGLSEYFIGEMSPEDSHTVLLGYGTLDEEQIEKGCAGLAAAWRK